MSLTSYRAAPPRWCVLRRCVVCGMQRIVVCDGLEDLAASDFPAPWGAVS